MKYFLSFYTRRFKKSYSSPDKLYPTVYSVLYSILYLCNVYNPKISLYNIKVLTKTYIFLRRISYLENINIVVPNCMTL
jgi:hypothetical protein